MDYLKVPTQINPALVPKDGTYGVQLYSATLIPFNNEEAFIRGRTAPSKCYNTYDSWSSVFMHIINGDGLPPEDAIPAKYIGFVNDPEGPQKFRLCVYEGFGCVGRNLPLILGGGPGIGSEKTYVNDEKMSMIDGLQASFRVIAANKKCFLQTKTAEQASKEEMEHRSPKEVLKRFQSLDWNKVPDDQKEFLHNRMMHWEKIVLDMKAPAKDSQDPKIPQPGGRQDIQGDDSFESSEEDWDDPDILEKFQKLYKDHKPYSFSDETFGPKPDQNSLDEASSISGSNANVLGDLTPKESSNQ